MKIFRFFVLAICLFFGAWGLFTVLTERPYCHGFKLGQCSSFANGKGQLDTLEGKTWYFVSEPLLKETLEMYRYNKSFVVVEYEQSLFSYIFSNETHLVKNVYKVGNMPFRFCSIGLGKGLRMENRELEGRIVEIVEKRFLGTFSREIIFKTDGLVRSFNPEKSPFGGNSDFIFAQAIRFMRDSSPKLKIWYNENPQNYSMWGISN